MWPAMCEADLLGLTSQYTVLTNLLREKVYQEFRVCSHDDLYAKDSSFLARATEMLFC